MKILLLAVLSLLLVPLHAVQLYTCIKNAFNNACKTKLYECTNNAECSYQLHENTQHIFLDEQSQIFPPLYFSNQLARSLYGCLKEACGLPAIDEDYPRTLPFDYCLVQVYDICRGNIEQVYSNPASSAPEVACYRKYCNFPKSAAS